MARNLTLSLSTEEVQLLRDLGKDLYPDASVEDLLPWAVSVARNGLRAEVRRLRLEVDARKAQEAQEAVLEAWDTAWPEEPDPLAPPPPEDDNLTEEPPQ